MKTPIVKTISACFIKPLYPSEEPNHHPPVNLAPWDLAFLSNHYIQKGLLFIKPTITNEEENPIESLLENLKESLSLTLVHFYPLIGRLVTQKQENPPSYSVYIDCNNSPGAKFIFATVDLTISDVLSPVDVPVVFQSFFDHHRAINHDGHSMPLLSIQVTELIDGIFIGCSMNHTVADGTSYWHFFNVWSNIFRAPVKRSFEISRPPILTRWFANEYGPIINLPFSHHDQFIHRFEAPPLRERIFHFSPESIAKLKSKANSECKTNKISSFQAVSALVWRCMVRARCLPRNQESSCSLAANIRNRMDPPLPNEYFGNSMQPVKAKAFVSELLEQGFGWVAWLLNERVAGHSDTAVREWLEKWLKQPLIYTMAHLTPSFLAMGSSPRFLMYENEFGMGKAVAIRSGSANKFDGSVIYYPGYEGGGSMDLEICLSPEAMSRLESDGEFMDVVNGCA